MLAQQRPNPFATSLPRYKLPCIDQLHRNTMTYSKETIWEKHKHMELNLFINIFKKEPGNIPPQAGDARGRRGEEWQGKKQRKRGFLFFFCLKVLFSSFQKKTRKARKSSQFGIPNTTTLDATQDLRFLFPPHLTAREEAGQRQCQISRGCYKQRKSPVGQLCTSLGLYYLSG